MRIAPAALMLLLLGAVAARGAEASRPNVLWLVADDHAAYVTGCYGNRLVRTPTLDALADSGIRFDRAYCNAPVCTASRQSFITGRYPRTIGVTLLRTPLPEAEVTLAEMLGTAGYETASIGKMHFNSGLKHGFDVRIDHAEYRQWMRGRKRRPVPEGVEVQPRWKPFKDPARIWLNAKSLPVDAWDEDYPGTYFARQGAEFLSKERGRPFFLMVSLYEPHSPFRFPLEFRGRHDPAAFPVPRVGPEDGWQIPAIFRGLTDREKQGINAAYYTSTEFMDKNMGIVLAALERSGMAENTLVVYLGDHGYMLGHHGRFEKHCSYEEADRAPLLMRFPGHIQPDTSSDAFVEFIDVVPTVLEFCGQKVPETVQGRSLVDLVTGKTARHRDHVVVEYAQNDEVMIRDGRWKLVYQRGKRRRTDGYDPGTPLPGPKLLLFDMQNDPGEFTNLAGRPEQRERVDHYRALLVEHLKQTSRQPELIPESDDPMVLLDHCVQPRDVEPPARKSARGK